MALQAGFHCLHRGLAQRHPFCVDFATELHYRLDSFPRHALGPLQHRVHIAQLSPIPLQFQNPPTALNRIILAVIGGIIEQLDGFADAIDQVHHPLEKLRAHATALWAVVHFELHPLNRVLLLNGEAVPPGRERIDDEVASLGGTAKGHIELGRIFIDDPTRDIFLRAPEVMVTSLVLPTRLSAARELSNFDRGFTVHAQPFDPWVVLARLVFFLDWQKWHRFPGSFSAVLP